MDDLKLSPSTALLLIALTLFGSSAVLGYLCWKKPDALTSFPVWLRPSLLAAVLLGVSVVLMVLSLVFHRGEKSVRS